MLLDQHSLGATWWDYAVEQWIRTANCRPHKNEWMNLPLSPQEIITSQSPDIVRGHKFPFGCPVSAVPPVDRLWNYAPCAEFGIAVGTSQRVYSCVYPRQGYQTPRTFRCHIA
jgi:hypothetical protein